MEILIVIVIIIILIIAIFYTRGYEFFTEVGDTEFPLWVEPSDYKGGSLVGKTAWINHLGNEYYEDRRGEKVKILKEIRINNRLVGLKVKHPDGTTSSAPIKDFWIDGHLKLLKNIYLNGPFTYKIKKLFGEGQSDYYGPSWNGIEQNHFRLAYFTDGIVLEPSNSRGGWYRYPSSTVDRDEDDGYDMDGKNWRIVIPVPGSDLKNPNQKPFTVVNFNSLLHDSVWTLVTTIYDDDKIDGNIIDNELLSDKDHWLRSMLWSIELTKILEGSGFKYSAARKNMQERVDMSRKLRPTMDKLLKQARDFYRKEFGGEPTKPTYISLVLNSWITPRESIGMYFPAQNKYGIYIPYGIIVVDEDALDNKEYTRYVIMHEVIHSLFGESCGPNSHHARFRKIGDLMGLLKKYQD